MMMRYCVRYQRRATYLHDPLAVVPGRVAFRVLADGIGADFELHGDRCHDGLLVIAARNDPNNKQ